MRVAPPLSPLAAQVILGNLPGVCPDWVGHRDSYAASETTWRKTAEQKTQDWANGCGWCSGLFVKGVSDR